MKPLTRDDFAIDAVTWQGKIRYSLTSKYQTFNKEEIVNIINLVLKAQKFMSIKEEMKKIDIDGLEEKFNTLSMEMNQSLGDFRKIKEKIESTKI